MAILGSLSAELQPRLYSVHDIPSLARFKTLCSQRLKREKYPLCTEVLENVPIYDARELDPSDPEKSERIKDEMYDILKAGSGVFVVRAMYQDEHLIQCVNLSFQSIIESEKSTSNGDHFGDGRNDRIWNSFEKLCYENGDLFFDYYSNPWLSLVSEAWLGTGSRLTAQVNVVKPRGPAQNGHRDYHLGFFDAETCARFPIAMQIASQHLTLQGAIAHSDMPVESGPTRLLPFSQMFEEGYMAFRLPEFKRYFVENYISLPLRCGDGLFFNPALFHAAGENSTFVTNRVANLLQISSAFGKPMERIRSLPLITKTWPRLKAEHSKQGHSPAVETFIRILAEGYPFPTNLDKCPPRMTGLAPESEQDLLRRALSENWALERLVGKLEWIKSP